MYSPSQRCLANALSHQAGPCEHRVWGYHLVCGSLGNSVLPRGRPSATPRSPKENQPAKHEVHFLTLSYLPYAARFVLRKECALL